jgi:hypothetical protein
VDLAARRKAALIEHITRQQRLLEQYEQARDLADDPKAITRADGQIRSIRDSLAQYQAELDQLITAAAPSAGASAGANGVADPGITRILFMASAPDDTAELRVDREMRHIQQQLRQAALHTRFTLETRMAVRPEDLTQALLDVSPRIVHFSGHGSARGELCLENHAGLTHPVTPDALAALFALMADRVECVLLNACYSQLQADAIVRHVPYAIGMSREIPDKAAIIFALGFYQALAAGNGIERAFHFGLVQLRLQNLPDDLMPVLRVKGR